MKCFWEELLLEFCEEFLKGSLCHGIGEEFVALIEDCFLSLLET